MQRRCASRTHKGKEAHMPDCAVNGDGHAMCTSSLRNVRLRPEVRALTQSARVSVAVPQLPAERVNCVVQQHMHKPHRSLLPHTKKCACAETAPLRRPGQGSRGRGRGELGRGPERVERRKLIHTPRMCSESKSNDLTDAYSRMTSARARSRPHTPGLRRPSHPTAMRGVRAGRRRAPPAKQSHKKWQSRPSSRRQRLSKALSQLSLGGAAARQPWHQRRIP